MSGPVNFFAFLDMFRFLDFSRNFGQVGSVDFLAFLERSVFLDILAILNMSWPLFFSHF